MNKGTPTRLLVDFSARSLPAIGRCIVFKVVKGKKSTAKSTLAKFSFRCKIEMNNPTIKT